MTPARVEFLFEKAKGIASKHTPINVLLFFKLKKQSIGCYRNTLIPKYLKHLKSVFLVLLRCFFSDRFFYSL